MSHTVDIQKLISNKSKLPKLPHQNDFILNLYNNNYSPETIYNYNRDLTFFALFLQDNNYKFEEINKLTITYYKGWLKSRKHIELIQKLEGKNTTEPENSNKSDTSDTAGSKKSDSDKTNATSQNKTVAAGEDSEPNAKNIIAKNNFNNNGNNKNKKISDQISSIQEQVKGSANPNFKGGYVKNNNPKELDANSINRILVSLRNYLRFLIEYDYPTPLAPDAVTLIRQPKKKPQVPTLEEVIALVEAPSTIEHDPIIALRNRAILETLLATGMRISEVVSLNRDQVNAEGKLFITGKGRKQRLVYLTPRALKHINEYLKVRKDPYPALFVPTTGRGLGKGDPRISTNYIQMKIAEYRRILGIVVPISAHTIRHAFATYLAEKGANPAAIQVLLGHESLQTTTRYVHASDKYAEKTHKKFHPVKE